jgi:uncharacterized protein YjiS (DUF1127 family)
MAFVTETLNLSHAPSLVERFATLRTKISKSVESYSTYRKVLAELSALSDRDLADMNMNRANITSIARQAAGM